MSKLRKYKKNNGKPSVRKMCDIQRNIHKFNGNKPFRWQRCHCGITTYGEGLDKIAARQKEKRRLEKAEVKREAALNAQ